MKPGTRVYWYRVDPKTQWEWRHGRGPKPDPSKVYGIVQSEPVPSKDWACLVAEEVDGKVVEVDARKLYVVMREIAL